MELLTLMSISDEVWEGREFIFIHLFVHISTTANLNLNEKNTNTQDIQ